MKALNCAVKLKFSKALHKPGSNANEGKAFAVQLWTLHFSMCFAFSCFYVFSPPACNVPNTFDFVCGSTQKPKQHAPLK